MNQNFSRLTNAALIEQLKLLISNERRTTAEILEAIKEVDARKLYLELGHTSLFAYLTESLGYSAGSAQRRIDAARLLRKEPEIKTQLKNGSVNLMQVSMVAQSLRRKQKQDPKSELPPALDLLLKIQSEDQHQAQEILARELEMPVKAREFKRLQADGSMRFETTFSKSEVAEFEKIKEIISHTHPGVSISEILAVLRTEFLKRRDPARETRASRHRAKSNLCDGKLKTNHDAAMNVSHVAALKMSDDAALKVRHDSASTVEVKKNPRFIPAPIRRFVFQRDQSCQHQKGGRTCNSKFQLQIDHKKPLWAGGESTPENLQLLCSTHNQQKYKLEAGLA